MDTARSEDRNSVMLTYVGPDFTGLMHTIAAFVTDRGGNVVQSLIRVMVEGVALVSL